MKVYLRCGPDGEDAVRELERPLPAAEIQQPMRFALVQLRAGPTEQEQRDGLSSFWSSHEQLLRSVRIVGGTEAIIDFHEGAAGIGNISTSTGGKIFADDLDTTVFQLSKIQTIEFSLEGSCGAFTEIFEAQGAIRQSGHRVQRSLRSDTA